MVKGAFVETRGNDGVAPIAGIRGTAMEPPGSILKSHSWPRQRIVGLTRKRSFAPDFCTRQSPAHANSASSAFASFRSAVSKPSVNQP